MIKIIIDYKPGQKAILEFNGDDLIYTPNILEHITPLEGAFNCIINRLKIATGCNLARYSSRDYLIEE